MLAYVLVRTKPGTSYQLVASRKIKGVKMADNVFGRYDAVLVIAAKDLEELNKIIYEVVEKHPIVEHTETLIAMPKIEEEKKEVRKLEITPISAFHCPSCNSLNELGSSICYFCGYEFS